jgi:hypothetical protein
MGKSTSYEIEKGLHLIEQTIDIGVVKPKTVETQTNHIAVIDCSGSMTGDLPRIREQLKKKLPKLLKDGDTLSIVWFSGRGEFGALLEAEPVATLADLNDVNKAVDRWLRPVGLTGFKEPLQEVEKLVARVGKKNKNPFALFFMSDGCDNQWNRADILKVVEQTAGGLVSSTFVEYGYYADRPLLAAMAEKAGGTLIFAEAFDKYEPMFEAAMQKRPLGGKRIEASIASDAIGGFVWTMVDGDLTTFDASTSKVHVPEQTSAVYYLSPTAIGQTSAKLGDMFDTAFKAKTTKVTNEDVLAAAYAAMSLFAVRMKPEIVYPILKATGDVEFIDAFSICFGKQKYSEFMDAAKLAAFDEKKRFLQGRDPKKVPADDAFTVLDLLRVLQDDDTTRLFLDHPEFKYSRISRGRVSADENLSADEQLSIEVVRQKMAGEKSAKKLKELQVEIDTILAAKRDALKFVEDPTLNGYEISKLTYNECSPNISVLIKKDGTVDLSKRRDDAIKQGNGSLMSIPDLFKTHIWRNYAIVSHGLVNVDRLPVKISQATHDKLRAAGVAIAVSPTDPIVVIDVKALPIINRQMVKAVSAKAIIELEWELLQKRAAQKVYKNYQDEKFPGVKMKSFTDLYTLDGANWLKEQGITPGGFSPKMVQAASIDFIRGKELEIKLKGCSKLDSVKAVREKVASGKKLNPCDQFMSDAINEVEAFFKKNPPNLHEKWLTGKIASTVAETRGLIYQTSQIKFGILVGQVWFTEFGSLDENQLTVKIGKQEIVGTCEMREIEIKI